jgi:predicted GNAT family N-acyltransferase
MATERSDTYSQFIRSYRIEHFKRDEDWRLFQEVLALRIQIIVQDEGFPLENEPDEEDDNALLWVVRDAKSYALVACARIVCKTLQANKPIKQVAVIDKMAVAPAHRGRGTGRFLLVSLLNHIRENEPAVSDIYLVAHPESIAFFESFGFYEMKPGHLPIFSPDGAVLLQRSANA